MEKKPNLVRLGTAANRSKHYPVSLAESLRQLASMVPLTKAGQARLEKAEREEAESKLRNSSKASKKPRL
jgi:hypothetical protein